MAEHHPLTAVTLKKITRKKLSSLSLIAVMLTAVLVCVILSGLLISQEAALQSTIENTRIRCTVTSANGATSKINVDSAFLDMLTGKRRDRDCYLDDYVTDVQAMAVERFTDSDDIVLKRIYSLDSDLALQQLSGGAAAFYDGWEEEVLTTSEKVCLVTEDLLPFVQNVDGTEIFHVATQIDEADLQVIGTVSGVSNTVYCPYYMIYQDGVLYAFMLDSCSFYIKDNHLLEESKAALFEYFAEPQKSSAPNHTIAGLLVQDETFQSSIDEINSNMNLIKILLPLLFVMTAFVNFFTCYLTNRRYMKEFAIMRCIGQKKREIFMSAFCEQGLLTFIGCAIGLIAGAVASNILLQAALTAVIVMLTGLLGSMISALQISSVNPIELMKVEE